MSNCIALQSTDKRLTATQFDVPALQTLVARVKDLREAPADPDGYLAWWFLAQNAEFDGGKSVLIRFGEGRSSHTWRDFQATLALLARFAKPIGKAVRHGFRVKDTDAPSKWGWMLWDLHTGELK